MILTLWAETLVESLIRSGVEDFVLCPGSRSTPFALAAARSGARLRTIVDERTASFYALGQARVSGRPSVLITTSGTAPAHAFPAVIEAAEAHVPLIVLSSDRPSEDQACRSPQTIDQLHLFGRHARAFFELGAPDPAALRALPRIAAEAFLRSLFPCAGPVHINAKARKPLEPVPIEAIDPRPPRVSIPRLLPDEAAVDRIAERIIRAKRGVIACGPSGLRGLSKRGAEAIARATGFPILPEATSNLRFCRLDAERIDAFEVLLPAIDPDLVIAFGSPMTSSRFQRFVETRRPAQIVVTPDAFADPNSLATEVIFADPDELAARLDVRIARPPWEARDANARAWSRVSEVVERRRFSEAHVARVVVEALADGDTLVVGNSLPVRHLDAYCPARPVAATVLSQRGANGIDGLVAGAAGAASVAEGRVYALVGDVSFLHDVGGLAVVRGLSPSIVVIDNGGGRIFEQLPVAESGAPMDLFVTPPELDLEAAAKAFGLGYARVESVAELRSALAQGTTIIVAKVPEHEDRAMRRELDAITEESWC